jgi:hypothetical protein
MSTTPSKKIQNLAAKLVETNDEITDIEHKFERALEEHFGIVKLAEMRTRRAALVEAKNGLAEQIKDEARKVAVVGENLALLDNEAIKVSVSGTRPKLAYDVNVAEENWPEEVLDQVCEFSIDTSKVAALVKLGVITAEMEAEARIEEPQTPKVSIRLAEVAPASAPRKAAGA